MLSPLSKLINSKTVNSVNNTHNTTSFLASFSSSPGTNLVNPANNCTLTSASLNLSGTTSCQLQAAPSTHLSPFQELFASSPFSRVSLLMVVCCNATDAH